MANASSVTYQFGDFTLDNSTRSLLNSRGHALDLSSRAFDTLLALVEHQGQTLSKKELMSLVWPDLIVEENNLNQAISTLRKALGDSKSQSRFIKTVPGRGYCFVAPVTVACPEVTDEAATPQSGSAEPSRETITSPEKPEADSEPGLTGKLWPWALAACLMLGLAVLLTINPFDTGISGQSAAGSATPAAAGQNAETGAQDDRLPNSVAVLPFSILNPEATANTLFATGLHDEIINKLSKIGSLNVISRSSILALADNPDTEAIARQYGVESVITGNILYAGDKARISLQMADAVNGVTLWAESYETDMRNIANMISIQSDIANRVATTLEATINDEEQNSIASIPTDSFEAYRYQLGARNAYFNRDFVTAWELARLSLEYDPNYADAIEMFASVNVVFTGQPMQGMTTREHSELAMTYANRLISLEPERPDGYVIRAANISTYGDWLGVANEIDYLQSMNTSPARMRQLGTFLMATGDFSSAIEIYKSNLATEPVNLFSRGFLLAALEMTGQHEEARREYALGEALQPSWWGDTIYYFLAIGNNEPLTDTSYLNTLPELLLEATVNVSDPSLVRTNISTFLASENPSAAEAIHYSALAAKIGDHDMAVQLMHHSLKDVWLNFYFFWLPVFRETRQTPEFMSLLMESGLVDYWNTRGWPDICKPTDIGISCN